MLTAPRTAIVLRSFARLTVERLPLAVSAPAVVSCAQEQGQLAERFVNERLSVWSKRLNLEGWQISVVMTRRDDLKASTLGGIRWDKARRLP